VTQLSIHRGLLTTLAAGFLLGATLQAAFEARHESSPAVTDFNSGFSDAKRDDCQQGFAAACQWLDVR